MGQFVEFLFFVRVRDISNIHFDLGIRFLFPLFFLLHQREMDQFVFLFLLPESIFFIVDFINILAIELGNTFGCSIVVSVLTF